MVITYEIPVKTVSEANLREHWAVRRKRTKEQRAAGYLAMSPLNYAVRQLLADRLIITLTRLGPRKMDSDNLARSMKAVRDGIADALGRDDGDERIDWRYRQEPGKKAYGVRVKIEEAT